MAMTQLKSKIIGTRISSYYKRLLFMARPTGRTHSRTVIAKYWKHSVLLPVEHHQLSYLQGSVDPIEEFVRIRRRPSYFTLSSSGAFFRRAYRIEDLLLVSLPSISFLNSSHVFF